MNSLVSIIIPCYNGEEYVGEAIQSALEQTYPNTEVVVIDDGSTDGSLEVIKSFGDSIKWEAGPNRGGSAARNRGLEMARGELIQFLDADDLLYPEKLEVQVSPMLEGKADMVCCDWEVAPFGEPEKAEQHRLNFEDGRADPVVFCLGSQLQTSSPLHWKGNLEAVGGFDEALPCSQEHDLHLRLAVQGATLKRIPRALFLQRLRAQSVSSDDEKVLTQHRKICRRAFRMLRDSEEFTQERALAFARKMARDGRAFITMGRPLKAESYFGMAREMHPDGVRATYGGVCRVLHDLLGPKNAQRIIALKQKYIGTGSQ